MPRCGDGHEEPNASLSSTSLAAMVDEDPNNIAEEDLGNGEEMGSDNDDNEESSEGDDMDDFLDEVSDEEESD
jgi:hypothetical protein